MNQDLAGIVTIIASCVLILIIISFKEKMGFLIRFVCRGVVLSAMIYGVNQALFFFGITMVVGINYVTFLTCAILGFPGVCLLYGLIFL